MAKSVTKAQIQAYINEYAKCAASFEYFCAIYIMLELPGGDVPFKMYDLQKTLIDVIEEMKHIIVLKSRQVGISTTIQAYCCWLLVFHANVVVGIISKDGPEATTFARTIAGMIDKLPNWMKPKGGGQGQRRGFEKRSEQSFILSNGSKCFAATVNPIAPEKTLRGKAITFLVVDEAAFVNKVEEAWTSMVPALSTSQKQAKMADVPYGTIILSTPNKTMGTGAFYYKRYVNAASGNDILTPFVIHWRDINELANDPDWYDTQCKLFNYDQKKINQELELVFLPSKGSFFDDTICQVLQEHTRDIIPLSTNRLYNGTIEKYANPIKGRFYLVGGDTAPEYGADNSAITVWDYMTMEQVWEYQGKLKVKDFQKVIQLAIQMYPGSLIIESNSYGNQLIENLSDLEECKYLYAESDSKKGLTTTSRTRPLMMDALYTYIKENPRCVKSKRLALELVGLVNKKNGKVEADSGCHDDIAMTGAMCSYVRKYDPPFNLIADTPAMDSFTAICGLNDGVKTSSDLISAVGGKKKPTSGQMLDTILNNPSEHNTNIDQTVFINTLDFLN